MTGTLRIIELRAADARDIDVVTAIMQAAFDPRYGEAWTAAQCLGMLTLPGVWLTIAEIDARPAGFALARTVIDDAELLLIATLPAMRGRGVGGALLRSVAADARTRGATRLHLEVRANNDAVRLYLREGFAQVGTRPAYYRGKAGDQYDAHSYARDLSQ